MSSHACSKALFNTTYCTNLPRLKLDKKDPVRWSIYVCIASGSKMVSRITCLMVSRISWKRRVITPLREDRGKTHNTEESWSKVLLKYLEVPGPRLVTCLQLLCMVVACRSKSDLEPELQTAKANDRTCQYMYIKKCVNTSKSHLPIRNGIRSNSILTASQFVTPPDKRQIEMTKAWHTYLAAAR